MVRVITMLLPVLLLVVLLLCHQQISVAAVPAPVAAFLSGTNPFLPWPQCHGSAGSPLFSSGRPSTPDSSLSPSATSPSSHVASPRIPLQSPTDDTIVERVGFRDVEIRLPERLSPLERVALSAEGDLQRIISSFHNAPVTVTIKRCAEVTPGVFDREVDLSVLGSVFCTATSSLSPKTSECAHLLREKSVGLGQLFRYLRVYPTFRLLEVGRTGQNDEGFWRLYELDCPEVINCRIHETFAPDTFHRQPLSGRDAAAVPSPLPLLE